MDLTMSVSSAPSPFPILKINTRDATVLFGGESELRLPARKAIQLGLHPQKKGMKRAKPDADHHIMTCVPQVFVEGKFVREGVEEIVGAYLTAQVDEREYPAYITKHGQPNNTPDDQATSPANKRKDSSTPPSPKANSSSKEPLCDCIVIGVAGQKKLGIKVAMDGLRLRSRNWKKKIDFANYVDKKN